MRRFLSFPTCQSFATRRMLTWFSAVLLCGSVGCATARGPARLQSEDDGKFEVEKVETVGDVTEVGNTAPIQVSGVGLVTGLDGTGGGNPPGMYRNMLEQDLRKSGNVKELLHSPNNAMVLVTAFIPAGSRKGDLVDIEVSLPPGSKATSLRGGYLQKCVLKNYDSTKQVSQRIQSQYAGSDKLLTGHSLAYARGPLVVGFGAGEEAARLERGRVWSGGVSLIDRPFYLVLKNDKKFARVASAVADRINLLFPDDPIKRQRVLVHKRLLVLDEVTHQINDKFKQAPGKSETARALNKEIVNVQVPYAYRMNPERYLRVSRLIPLREIGDNQGRYRRQLEHMLLDPATTMRAALRLEALGKESVPILLKGLKNDHPLVRFSAAEALAYRESIAGAEELARLAEQQPALRAYCLTALTSLEESICFLKLSDMLESRQPEVQYGAFRALRILVENSDPDEERGEIVQGQLLNNSFWLHRVAPLGSPLVHVSTSRRAEIVCFGAGPELRPPFKILAGKEFTVTAEPEDKLVTVSRFVTHPPDIRRRQCSNKLDDVLKTMGELGGQYADVVELLRQAEIRRCLTCAVAIDKLPPVLPVEELAKEGTTRRYLVDTR
jgi:hypothetical protein